MKYLIVLLFSVAAFADDPEISVQGNCEIKVTPDRGAITFTAENQARDQKDAVKKTTEQINQLKEEIKKLNLADLELKNTNYNVFPVREYEKEKIVDKGIRATLSLEVTTSEIARIGEAMQSAAKVGVINVGSLTTFLSLEKSQKEYLKCLDIAADDAKGKAQQLAKKLGFKLGDVIKLNEVPQMPQPVPVMERAMMKSMDAAPAQIEPGTQQYSTNIQVTFKIK
ncbi:SIMPL domain-containing protein [Peredibacter starrii]|uniref:SIMPL domain-containing protein n=1 Tax=Peredibacter starrii TaxID=28202 RepID=A0AAX4HJQ1_9BACT|nr:SIMPL domain-containing protein [Peredibacter starrii]WPU63447.1 SIMPL domain-containing protein [Peredibacter starrii]